MPFAPLSPVSQRIIDSNFSAQFYPTQHRPTNPPATATRCPPAPRSRDRAVQQRILTAVCAEAGLWGQGLSGDKECPIHGGGGRRIQQLPRNQFGRLRQDPLPPSRLPVGGGGGQKGPGWDLAQQSLRQTLEAAAMAAEGPTVCHLITTRGFSTSPGAWVKKK